MNKRKKIGGITGLAALIIGLYGCITDYTPTDINEQSDLLVIESTITNGTTHVKISQSVGLLDYISLSKTIENATVYVETEDGNIKLQGRHIENGNYEVETGNLNMGAKYRLRITADGKEYASSYLAPLVTPEIDSIFWTKQQQGDPVYINVSTHNAKDQSRYYRWSYQENWEIKAEMFANAARIDGRIIYFDLVSSNNRYYCWSKDVSNTLLLESSEKLSENVISRKRLKEISPSNSRFSSLYHILVSQVSLRQEAYNYFSNLQKNVEQTGGIFSSMPSESKGNISCLSDPDLPVIGYVEVATTTQKELYIPHSDGLYESSSYCYSQITEDSEIGGNEILNYMPPPGSTTYAPARCVNCLVFPYSTKDKPSWWPSPNL